MTRQLLGRGEEFPRFPTEGMCGRSRRTLLTSSRLARLGGLAGAHDLERSRGDETERSR